MLSASLLVAALAALLAAILSGFTGFGHAVVVVPLLLLVYDPKTVVALAGALSASVAALVVWDSWREADRRVALALLAPAIPGLWVGSEVLRAADPAYLRLAVGVMVVVAAFLLAGEVRLSGGRTAWGPSVAGFASGALASSTGLSGPPAALLLESRGITKEAFRATISLYFLGLDLMLLTVLAGRGLVDAGRLASLALFLVGVTLVGKALGTTLLGKVSQKTFRAVVLGTVILAGVLGIATALRALV